MDDFVAKPFEMDEVLTKIAKHVLASKFFQPFHAWGSGLRTQ